ncbi:MAG: glycosyltransferase [Candidatus Nanopelagicales bacterium]
METTVVPSEALTQSAAIVIPVYRGGVGLERTLDELRQIRGWTTSSGVVLELSEIILVCDQPKLMVATDTQLEGPGLDPRARTVWLTKNYGQHPATVAGIASSNADWVVTMDEDGQHDPSYIPAMFDAATEQLSSLVYAKPSNPPPHGGARNAASGAAKKIFKSMTGQKAEFHSFRLMEGSVARAVSAYTGPNVYLDIALAWALDNPTSVDIPMRAEYDATSSYSFRSLLSHFWRMVLSSGTRPLRAIAAFGTLLSIAGFALALYILVANLFGSGPPVAGWASVMVVTLFIGGSLLVAVAILAEYIGYAVHMAMGKPLYVVSDNPEHRALTHAIRFADRARA